MKINDLCNLYKDGIVPPCAQYLNNNLIIKDGILIFRNLNRLFFFISIQNDSSSISFEANYQISMKHYIIGLFLYELFKDFSKYDKDCKIDSDPKTNKFIHKLIQNPPKKLNEKYKYFLTLVYSNQDAIVNPFTYNIEIKAIIFYILIVLSRFENNPGLFFANNNFVSDDPINFILSSMHLKCPMNELYNNEK